MDDQLEHIRSRIVSRDIELPARPGDALRIHLAEEDALLFLQRAGNELPVWVDDDAVAGIDPS